MDIFPSQIIKVIDIKDKGRGVVATRDIKSGEIIEACPILFISKEETDFLNNKADVLKFYILEETSNNRSCLMLGCGSIYNHSENPNAEIDYNEGKQEDFLFFKAIKDIKTGEEIVYNYEFNDNKVEFLKQ